MVHAGLVVASVVFVPTGANPVVSGTIPTVGCSWSFGDSVGAIYRPRWSQRAAAAGNPNQFPISAADHHILAAEFVGVTAFLGSVMAEGNELAVVSSYLLCCGRRSPCGTSGISTSASLKYFDRDLSDGRCFDDGRGLTRPR